MTDTGKFRIGDFVRFNHECDSGPDHCVVSVMRDGMIEIHDMGGYFAPHLFVAAAPVIKGITGTDNVFEAKAREIFKKILTVSDAISAGHRVTVTCERENFVSAIAKALEAERMEERGDIDQLADAINEVAVDLANSYSHLPKDQYPGPPNSLVERLVAIAASIRNRSAE